MIKVLDLYAGIGGNRKNWTDVEVTAIELNTYIAEVYMEFFPEDLVYICDAHEYLLNHYKEYDFIWSSIPCKSHSELKRMGIIKGTSKPEYPDLKLYEEIIFLKEFSICPWVVENVKPYYDYLIEPNYRFGRHSIWCNFEIENFIPRQEKRITKTRIKQGRYGFNLTKFHIPSKEGKLKRQVLRNLLDPELGEHILNNVKEEIKLRNN